MLNHRGHRNPTRPGALPEGKSRRGRATTDGAGSAHHPQSGRPSDDALRTQKKTTPLDFAQLIGQLVQTSTAELQQALALPQHMTLNFDVAAEAPLDVGASMGHVLKTSCRTVVSLELGCFRARELVRYQEGQQVRHSTQLASLVPPGARYGFDLIAHVGVESFLRGHSLQDIRRDLASRPNPPKVPLSTLWDLQRKFLFYLGHLHQQAAASIRQYLEGQGETTWLLDGTIEPGTPVFLGIE